MNVLNGQDFESLPARTNCPIKHKAQIFEKEGVKFYYIHL